MTLEEFIMNFRLFGYNFLEFCVIFVVLVIVGTILWTNRNNRPDYGQI